MQATELAINSYYTLIAATIVLLFGKFLVQKIKFLQDFNIPEPVAGGLVAAEGGRSAAGYLYRYRRCVYFRAERSRRRFG